MKHFLNMFVPLFLMIFILGCQTVPSQSNRRGNTVKVSGTKGHWELIVNEKPFVLKGVGVSRAASRDGKADFLKLAQELGANTVRTWGIDQGTREYLDKAYRYGLYVDAGIWLNPVYPDGRCSYITDKHYQKEVREQALRYIRKYKDHPAILFWNIGNETIFWTKDEQERIAFCRFLESLIQEVHRIDPNHLVIYSSSFTTAVPYIKQYVPSLDILGINVYGGFEEIQSEVSKELDIPYMITEFGPLGNWDSPKDKNEVSYESTDQLKAQYYKQYAHKIQSFYGFSLGGFAFLIGDTSQVSFTWWNMNHGAYKKFSYWTIEDFYKERPFRPAPFLIKNLIVSKKVLRPNEEFDISVELTNPSNQAVRYEYFASTASEAYYSEEYPNKKVYFEITGDGPVVKAKAPTEAGVYRVYAVVFWGDFASTFNKSIRVSSDE